MMYVKTPSPHSSQTTEEPGLRVLASSAGAALAEASLGADLKRLSPEDIYRNLMEACALGCDAFDAHVVASILAVSSADAGTGAPPQTASAGLSAVQFSALITQFFPKAAVWRLFDLSESVERNGGETCLLELLERCATSREPFEMLLAAMIARRAERPNHLWQDLGLRHRGELNELMTRHFKPLALRNKADMKWKKFFYRLICADASFSLCTAPSCGECGDFAQCFGEETGMSLLASVRRPSDSDAS
jgi:nitrogen fixation protein NifQ